jgi:hypothetical protein
VLHYDDLRKMISGIRPGSVTYLDSYKVSGITHSFIKTDTFDIEPGKCRPGVSSSA